MYTIKILASNEFEELPYKRVATSLGVADPESNTAYVRFTAIPELNKYLIDHEFEHLIEETPTDEEDGVRYAGFKEAGKFFGNMFGGGGGGNIFSQNKMPVPNMLSQSQLAYQNKLDPTSGGSGGGGFGGFMSGMLPGIAGMLGSQLIPNPKVPQLPASFGQFNQMAQAGGPPVSQAAQGSVQNLLNTPFQQVSEDEQKAATHGLDISHDQELRQMSNMYKSLMPGTDPMTNGNWQRDQGLLEDRYARARAETLAQLQRGAYTNYAGIQNQAAGVGGQLGQQNMQQRQQALQTEYYPALQAYQASLDKRTAFRDALQGLASLPLQMNLLKFFRS